MKYLHSLQTYSLYSLSKLSSFNQLNWWLTSNSTIYKNKIYVVRILKEITKHLIKTKISLHTLDLCELLYTTNSIIAGSLTLQCYLDEYFEDSDLDIFTFQNNINFQITETIAEPTPNYNSEWKVATFNSIQVIYINKEYYITINDFINTFDIDICKIIFDGRNFHFPIKYPKNLKNDRIAKVTGEINPRLYTRIIKYQNRNFEVKFDENKYIPYKLYNLKFKFRNRFYNKDYKFHFEIDLKQKNDLCMFLQDKNSHNYHYYKRKGMLYKNITDDNNNIILNYYGNYEFYENELYDFTILLTRSYNYYSPCDIYYIIYKIKKI